METTPVPTSFLNDGSLTGGVAFVPYISSVPIIKGRVVLEKHMISLITEGEKLMYVEDKKVHLTPEYILLMASGNVLFTERMGERARIKSTMIFFDNQALQNALGQYEQQHSRQQERTSHLLAHRDDYLRGFIDSVNILMEQGLLSAPLQQAKLNELLLYLYGKHPDMLAPFISAPACLPDEDRLRQVVEAHVSQQLTLSELAFLCNMSLPTFKRKFEQVYHESPARWLQVQRLMYAAARLRAKKAKPGEVYLDAGYENHSSFSKAFRQYFGILPKDYV